VVTLASKLGLQLATTNVTVTRPAVCAGTAGFSSVTINYTFTTIAPVLIPGLSAVNLRASSCYYNMQ
jgi:hypothetical protein